MNFPGVLFADGQVLAKISASQDKVIDGHAPGLGGNSLILSNQLIANTTAASVIGNGAANNFLTLLTNTVWNGGGQNLTVGSGTGASNTLVVSGGTLTNLGTLTATGVANRVAFNAGTISASGAVISNSGTAPDSVNE